MVISAQELCAIEKNGHRWHGQQEDRDHAGLAVVDNEAVVTEDTPGGRDGVDNVRRQRRRVGSCVSCVPCISRLTSLELHVISSFFQWD